MTEKLRLVRAEALAATVPYSYAAVVAGSVVFTAGAWPLDAAGQVVHVGDPAAQAGAAVANLETALRAAGCGLSDVAKSTVFVASTDRVVSRLGRGLHPDPSLTRRFGGGIATVMGANR